jgi:hypothetical protein
MRVAEAGGKRNLSAISFTCDSYKCAIDRIHVENVRYHARTLLSYGCDFGASAPESEKAMAERLHRRLGSVTSCEPVQPTTNSRCTVGWLVAFVPFERVLPDREFTTHENVEKSGGATRNTKGYEVMSGQSQTSGLSLRLSRGNRKGKGAGGCLCRMMQISKKQSDYGEMYEY